MKREETYFLPYQRAWREDASRLKLCEKSRQVGLSYVDSYDSVLKAACRGGRDVWVMSRDETQAKEYIRYCKRWAGVLHRAAVDFGERILKGADGKSFKAQVLTFASLSSIHALSSNPDAIVGKTGNVKLDEFALHKDQRTLYAVAKPVIQWGGSLSVISTHRGVCTVFNELVQDIRHNGNRMGWSLHTIPIQRAVGEGLVEKINAATRGSLSREDWMARQRAECIDEEQWLQEYCCVPADESVAFISYNMITACEDASLEIQTSGPCRASGTLYLGVDVARKEDLCVLDIGELAGDVMWDRVRIELHNRPFSEIKACLWELLRLPGLKRACLDATGMGMQLAEEARAEFGWKVEGINFTGPVKEELAFGLRTDFEDRKLRIPRDERLRADLRGIKKEVTLSGNIRFGGETADSHCDRFWAKALRQHAARHQTCCGALVG